MAEQANPSQRISPPGATGALNQPSRFTHGSIHLIDPT